MKYALISIAIVSGLCGVTKAHEFWIEPQTHHTKPGTAIGVGLRLGERFLGEVFRRDDALIDKFVAVGPDGEQHIVGLSGATTSFARFDKPGAYVLGYRSHRTPHEMDADRFEAYLKEEGLGAIIPQRAKLNESDKPGREVFSRCAKSLVLVGDTSDRGYKRKLGFPLEIVPESNPLTLKPGNKLPVRILFNGKPLKDAKVVAVSKQTPSKMQTALSNNNGLVHFELPRGGAWMITTIHMTRVPELAEADWESFWASFTFEITEPNETTATSQERSKPAAKNGDDGKRASRREVPGKEPATGHRANRASVRMPHMAAAQNRCTPPPQSCRPS